MKDSKRIPAVDGLRALAVLGVIWVHVWSMAGYPATLLLGRWGPLRLDLQRGLSMVETGVDLFFVLSGFCLYMMYIGKERELSWTRYGEFIKRRWLRLAPAYYAAVLIGAVGWWVAGLPLTWKDIAAHLGFVSTILGAHTISPPFWSLCTEWHFYMILPVVLWAGLRWGFRWVLLSLMGACIIFRVIVYTHFELLINHFWGSLPLMLIEFCWGMIVGRLYERRCVPPRLLRGNSGFLAGLGVVLAGRILMSEALTAWAGPMGAGLRVASLPVVSLGYALMLWNVIFGPSVFARILCHPIPQTIGRWSYSLYLWHYWPCVFITGWVVRHWGQTLLAQYSAFALLLLVLIPFGGLSYRWLEAPYFTRWRVEEKPA